MQHHAKNMRLKLERYFIHIVIISFIAEIDTNWKVNNRNDDIVQNQTEDGCAQIVKNKLVTKGMLRQFICKVFLMIWKWLHGEKMGYTEDVDTLQSDVISTHLGLKQFSVSPKVVHLALQDLYVKTNSEWMRQFKRPFLETLNAFYS